MQIRQFSLGTLQTNCYFVSHNRDLIIIDPGDSAEFILEGIQRSNLNPIAFLATHGHFDHILAVGELQLSLKIPLYIFKEDMFLVRRLNETARYFLHYDPQAVMPSIVQELESSDKFLQGTFSLKVIPTPGHTPGSCSFYFQAENIIFTGDTLFRAGIGDYSHKYSSFSDLKKSLSHLLNLPDETIVYPGHGAPTTIAKEKLSLRL